MKEQTRAEPRFSLCGLNCGLCPMYHISETEHCTGCGGAGRPSCAVQRCAREHGGVEYCFQCTEYPCARYTRAEPYDSFVPHRNVQRDFARAARDGLDDRLAGLDAGADDYVVKPFHMSEVLARLRAIERRRQGAQAASKVLTNGTMTLNCETKTVRLHAPEGDKEVALSKREFDLMEALMTRPGAILSRTTLEERLYGDGDMPESNALEFIIHGLRKKLGANAIGNVRGLGWMVHKGRAAGR